ncbi:7679_t:CDS:1 [Cetraspora pellucida]|uniref:7679_t:CDS:1 n=1 Tax=Cetraspora pellucida TaxID=1433469 RepID=A0A9N9BG02_9GLOM|nr:7679_t:CDS:1 [Cetraspora pellucida]
MKYKAIYTFLGLIWLGLLTYTTSTPLSPALNQVTNPKDLLSHHNKRFKKHRPVRKGNKNGSDSQPEDTSDTSPSPDNPSTVEVSSPDSTDSSTNPTDASTNPTGTSKQTSPTGNPTGTLSSYPTNTNPPVNLATANSPGIFQPFKPLARTNGPVTRKYTFTCKRTNLDPDGFTRVVWAVNGQ